MTAKAIREWLLDRAKQEFFSFDTVDFDQDIDEMLDAYAESDDKVSEDAYRIHCWQLLQAWQRDREYLASLNLHIIIARHVRNSCRKASDSQSIESWVDLGLDSTRLDGPQLANEIEDTIRAAWKVRAPWRADAVPKFSEELLLESLDKFHLGLENVIGYPPTNKDFLDLMMREHEQGEPFQDQEGREVDPKVEWNIVMRRKSGSIPGASCEPAFEIKRRIIGMPLDFYVQKAKGMFSDARAFGAKGEPLMEAEVAALRLWTGPMHIKYAQVLRNPKKHSGPYVTTLHALNSGITKLARIWRLPASRKVYRGYRNLSLKELKKDAFQCAGGVEKSVLATTEDFNIAVQYSGDGAFILEMDVGQVNRGADVSWVSQFPHEQEILFNALSNVEFICSPQLRFVEGRGTILVYQVCVSTNVRSKTLVEFVSMRKDLHRNLVDVLTQEVRRVILREENSRYDLIKSLCAECRNQCDCIVKEAGEADVCIFNKGAPEYVTLVKDAILLQSRVLQILELALHWFETGHVDPSELDGLQDWQLEALRAAFTSGDVPPEVPYVKTLVLDSEHVSNQVCNFEGLFTGEYLKLGVVHNPETACRAAKLLTLNPNLYFLRMEVASGTAEVWEQVFKLLCPGRPTLQVNGVILAEYAAVNTLQQLELRNLGLDMSAMIAPALQFHTPSALTSLSLWGSPIGCTGAESLGRAFGNLEELRYLDLRSCKIADRGCTGISRGLPALTALEDLNLAHNNVTDDGFNILATGIRTVGFSRLKLVDMRWNYTHLPSLHCEPKCVMRNHISSKFKRIVSCMAWSPGGDQIASGSYENTIIIWDAKTGEQVSTFKGHSDWVKSVAWRPGGDQIASGSLDRTIIIWDANTGEQVSTLKGHSAGVNSVAWRPGGDQIASGSVDKAVIIWDAKTGEQVSTLKGHTARVTCVAWRPGGDQIVSGGDGAGGYVDSPGEIIIWDAKTGEQVSTLKGHTAAVTSVAWRPGGDQIASGSYDETIIIWDAKTGEQVSTLKGHKASVMSVAWRPRGDQIASASLDNTVIIWDAKSGEQIFTPKGHTDFVTIVVWHPGGDQMASASNDEMIIIWDVHSGPGSTLKGHTRRVTSVAWRPGGDQIVSGGYGAGMYQREASSAPGEIIIWDTKTGDQVSILKGHTAAVNSVAWRPGGDQIASGSEDRTIIIWDAKTCEQVSTLKGHSRSVNSVAWHPGGDQIVSGSGIPGLSQSEIIIWDPKTGDQIFTLKGHTGAVMSVAWHPGGDQIASASLDNTVIIWDTKTGGQVSMLKGHTIAVTNVAWRPGGDQIASASIDKTIIIWDAMTGKQISTLKYYEAMFTCMAYHDIVRTYDEYAIDECAFWDAKAGQHISMSSYAASTLAWCPRGDRIASRSADMTIIIWDAKTCEQVSTLKGHKDSVTGVAWNPDGTQIASASDDETIIMWDVRTGRQLSTFKGNKADVMSLGCRPGQD